jgi:hypothetical protein
MWSHLRIFANADCRRQVSTLRLLLRNGCPTLIEMTPTGGSTSTRNTRLLMRLQL